MKKFPTIAVLALTAAAGLAACSASPGSVALDQPSDDQVVVGQRSAGDPGSGSQSSDSSSAQGGTQPGSGADSSDSNSGGSGENPGRDSGSDSSGEPSSAVSEDSGSSAQSSQQQSDDSGDEYVQEPGSEQSAGEPDHEAIEEEVADVKGPAISQVSKRCSGANLLTQWRVQDDSGVRSVVVSRDNEFGAAISSNAKWLGPETGDGNHWAATINGAQNLDDTIEVRAVDNLGNTSVTTTQAPAGC